MQGIFLFMNIISEQPWYFILLCVLAGGLYAALLYRHQSKKDIFSRKLLYVLSVFRFCTVFLISLLLLNIFLKRTINQTEKPLILFAQDNSASVISTKDSASIKTAFIPRIEEIKSALASKYNVQSILFGSKTQINQPVDFTDKETDISQLLSEIENSFANQNIGALVIASDGIINKGTSPLYIAEKFKFPVYCIALGDTNLKKDAIIQKVNHNQVVYLGNKFPVEVIVQSVKLNNKNLTIGIYQDNIKKSEQSVKINSDNATQTFNFVLEADKPGVQKYAVRISSVAEETNLLNNSQSFVIDVIDNREKILILANAPHPDIAAIKESIESGDAYEVESAIGSSFSKPLKPYSLVILHSMQLGNSKLLNELKNNAQPYLIINPQPNDILPGVKISSGFSKFNEVEAVVNKNFTLFSVTDELRAYVKQFPALHCWFGNYSLSPASNCLFFQKIGSVETENPVILFNENSGQKTGVFVGDGFWKWKLRDFADHNNHHLFNEIINKTVQYLSVKADKSFFRLFTKKIITENEAIEFNAEVYNQSYELITDPEVSVILTDENNRQFNYTLSRGSNSYHIEAGLFPPGEYKYKANVTVNGQLYSHSGSITVKAIVAENINTVADHQLLFQMSAATGGKLFLPSQLDALEKELTDNEMIKPVTYTQKELNDLINLKWIFFLVLALLSIEWFLRKRAGSI
jgi:hypothetical protein